MAQRNRLSRPCARVASERPAEMAPIIGRILEKLFPAPPEGRIPWDMEVDLARHEQDPLRARTLLYFCLLLVLAVIIWAAYAPIEEVTRGQGRVIPSRQVQVIQAVDGGVVSEILVAEGDVVEPGQTLLRIDPTRFVSELRQSRAQLMALEAKAERLKALSENREFKPSEKLQKAVPDIVAREKVLHASSLSERQAQTSIARQQLAQRKKELKEARANRDQLEGRINLLRQELDVTRPLVSSGAVSEVEVLRLERDLLTTEGERDQVNAQIERIESAISEAEDKVREVELSFNNRIRRDLAETLGKIEELNEAQAGLADRVKRTDVVSPVKGTIKRLLVNTVGGFVRGGDDVIEIVPLDDSLIIEARIHPKDIGFLRPGQKATVRFSAYDFAIYGSLEGRVEQIGADSVIDERGNAYYIARVRTLKPNLGEGLPIIPGMMATVDIITGEKTVLTYLLKPILRAKMTAMRER